MRSSTKGLRRKFMQNHLQTTTKNTNALKKEAEEIHKIFNFCFTFIHKL